MRKIAIIGSGFSSLAAAAYLSKAGYHVDVFEKNEQVGGRARILDRDGFRFDMGPSWYWMPDVFERFFNDFDKKPSDYYELIRLSPGYRVHFDDFTSIDVPDTIEDIYATFEKEEKGSSIQLQKFLEIAEYNYEVAIKKLVYKPGVSPLELITPETIANVNQFFTNISSDIRKRFKSPKLIKILEFPVLFLGAKPQDTPAFYSFMNYADFVLGTWYPKGGMYSVVEGIIDLCTELGVHFHTNSNIDKIVTDKSKVIGLEINNKFKEFDIVLSGADYAHTETLLDKRDRGYSENYWKKKTFAPSALLFYVGFDTKIKNVLHHELFFDKDFDGHAQDIYDEPKWPEAPLFYSSFTSVTDDTIAPKGKEAGVFLIPLAPDLEDTEELRNKYFEDIISRLEAHTHQSLKEHILFKQSYCVSDFKKDYNSYKGNAYGMANTLLQTAFLRPKISSKKLDNLYFTGQLTVPGPGVPPALISGKLAAELICKDHNIDKLYETSF